MQPVEFKVKHLKWDKKFLFNQYSTWSASNIECAIFRGCQV